MNATHVDWPQAQILELPDGGGLAVRELGAGTPVVLVHGLGLDGSHWRDLATRLAAAGYRAIAYDQRGFGQSRPPSSAMTLADMASDLQWVVERTVGAPVHLVGHSLGGMVAQTWAVRQPECLLSLTLIATTAHNGDRASRFAAAMSRVAALGATAALADPQFLAQIEPILVEAFPFGPPPLEQLFRGLEQPDTAQSAAWQTLVGFSVKDAIVARTGPTLVAHGTHDTWIPYPCGDWLGRSLPGARFVAYEGTGHFPHLKHRDDFAARLLAFFGGDPAS